ncbi:MAG: NAD(P)/FAD-dependent oxidoreductase [Tateyamaria sp.]|jgi:predicted Rossmann fold flavoprotein|uniref:NAD(P)/FAD-dependent oxidoreductase n=1 Tax=unclassified Tateyamaria TaxID=2645127 RepID=UPI000D54E2DA|nr:NAD(P)/FAD-dependent oxidoreductase [Tateyamaria sp. Alg231-49]
MDYDTLVIGAGAAGMMCAAHAGGRVLVVDHARAPGEKIRISGGGRCNFTNMYCDPQAFISENPHFVKSALARYTQWDFIALVDQHGIAWHEKTLGQLFCDVSAKDIVAMLRKLMQDAGVDLHLQTEVSHFAKSPDGFKATLVKDGHTQHITAKRAVIASGGKSIPKMGATGFAYDIARQFGHRVTETEAALVPFTFPDRRFAAISGVACPARVQANGPAFDEALLFTHRGLSGPAVLQASNYWHAGEAITVNLCPNTDLAQVLKDKRTTDGKKALTTELARHLPARLVEHLSGEHDLQGRLGDASDTRIAQITNSLSAWSLTPSGTEGYRTAEVTRGGIDTATLNSKTMESKSTPGLYFIGEAVDVTGWLGGYNFQWAWSSAMASARALQG